ncbi:DUF732 domain-containing protein [Mycolicibacterium fortuitum]|uniref:DUF732 domain-containing protein n=1 Tax=Mycolicibacterium fortuitum TaxID=1766 RepID=UPI0006CAF1DF|nr:DUF732 domain-containing protein [Mycolicibacterium fortuitum]
MPATVRRTLGTALAIPVLVLAGMPWAAPAYADTQSYLDVLHAVGINVPGGISTPGGDIEMKEWGWEVCALFAMGVPADKVRDQAVYNSGSSPQYGMSVRQADAIVSAAVSQLCTGHG